MKTQSLRDVHNLDESGLFFRMLANRSLTTEDKANGAKMDQTNCYHLSLAKL